MEKMMKKISKLFLSFALVLLAFSVMPKLTAQAASNDELTACSKVFDGAYYAALYPDVAASVNGSQLGLLNHYVYFGIYEGRNASAAFNATDYMNKNPDLQALYGDNLLGYVFHYVNAGKAEGRDATPVAGSEIVIPSNYTLLGIYSTEYNAEQARATNIKIAADHVNGTVVESGKTFSASRSIGPRNTENGFVTAPVFINKEHAMGIGGGVCQVSSTIYAAMKTAGIAASERHPHSLPVNYLPAGWDATISGNALDLKFVNHYDSNIVIYETANNGILTAALYLEN
ncbi:VanW family protein [Pseudobutyrivibrio xylanivorans]|uniref:Vancomycin resistance protein n=1 Tax=Pseudobutyrivibrio xylanivorans TaxID=185007 RepID=A0A5P6VV13_PSEXY|nr:VanW family protein [Pseudobutyrivibrio xylanivorans]QFJ56118.1 vancomycin resistance protein [Pseudobutyrivibrio xylanivorans]